MMATAGEKVNQASQAVADARQRALQPVTELMGDMAKKMAEYADKYPGLTTALTGATDGIKVMTAAAIAFGGVKMLTGAGAGVGVGAAAAGVASGTASVAGRAVGVLAPTRFLGSGVLARSAPLASVALGGYDALQVAGSDLTEAEKNAAYTRIGGRTSGGIGGAYAGGQALAFLGPYGIAAGAIGGGILGSLTGDWAGEKLGQAWFGPGEARPETAKAATISTGGIDPVSYTHLDVYKRQPVDWAHERANIPKPAAGQAVLVKRPTPGAADAVGLAAAASQLGAAVAALTGTAGTATAAGQVSRLAAQAAPTMDDWIAKVRDLVDQAKNLQEVRDGLLALAPQMSIEEYAALLAEALTAAGLAGRVDILDQARG